MHAACYNFCKGIKNGCFNIGNLRVAATASIKFLIQVLKVGGIKFGDTQQISLTANLVPYINNSSHTV